jgi:3-hydroxyacyl-CoA dehydrogenase
VTVVEPKECTVTNDSPAASRNPSYCGKLSFSNDFTALANVDLVINTLCDTQYRHSDLLAKVGHVVGDETVIASTAGWSELSRVSGTIDDPFWMVGLHFFCLVGTTRLLEVVTTRATSPAALDMAKVLGSRLNTVSVVSKLNGESLGIRILGGCFQQVMSLLLQGVSSDCIDEALEQWGFVIGPCKIAAHYARAPQKPFPELRQLSLAIDTLAARGGGKSCSMNKEEIVNRCLFAMVNESARIMGEGGAHRSIDIDIVSMLGLGIARERGGILFHADLVGPSFVLAQISEFAADDGGHFWAPAPLLRRLVDEEAFFSSI